MILTEENLIRLINEELTKTEVNSMISRKLDDNLNSREFKKKVKEISANIIRTLFQVLWQHNSMWTNRLKNS